MTQRPHVTLKTALSLDGCIDDEQPVRRIFSNAADALAVDRLRSEHDAILVGAQTVRNDNPSLTIRDPELIAARVKRGQAPQPLRVTLSASGFVPAERKLFMQAGGPTILYTTTGCAADLGNSLGDATTVVALDAIRLSPEQILEDLAKRGVKRLIVEGGTQVITAFLQAGLVDHMRLAIAPEVIGSAGAPRFATALRSMPRKPQLLDANNLDGMAILLYEFAA